MHRALCATHVVSLRHKRLRRCMSLINQWRILDFSNNNNIYFAKRWVHQKGKSPYKLATILKAKLSKEGRGAVGVEGGVVWWRGWVPLCPEKNHFFHDALFNRQKTRTVTRSLGRRILRFSRETKLRPIKSVQKLSKNSRPDKGRSHHHRLPE